MWEDRYSSTLGYLFGTDPAQVLTENPWISETAATALCVADGEGRNAVHLARLGLKVTTFDLAPTAVSRARFLADDAGVALTAHQSNWADWDFTQTFDLVVAIFIQFAGPALRNRQFANLKKAVRPGGRLLLHGYRPEQIALGTGGPPDGANMYTPEMLADAFSDWTIDRLAAYERDVQEGRGHVGTSALIDLVARRPA